MICLLRERGLTLYPVFIGCFLASLLWHSRIVRRIMKIVSELAGILLVFVQKMSGIFLAGGEYREVLFFLVVGYVVPLTSLVVIKELCVVY